MNESYWYNYYGGSNVPSVTSQPSANEKLYRNPYVLVDHYYASGGLFVAGVGTRTARGFSISQALSYAQSWIQSNGGMPSDAALTFAGEENITPSTAQATSDQPYPNIGQYIFTWRHAESGLLGPDRIDIAIDDNGHLTTYTKYVQVWDIRLQLLCPKGVRVSSGSMGTCVRRTHLLSAVEKCRRSPVRTTC